jgi:hypothetical protein
VKKAERLAHINERAYELAESGTCRNWQMIETKIRAEGYEEARGWLDNGALRMILNEICARNWNAALQAMR